MLRESWKRPSVLLLGWVTILVLVFVWTGDLRVQRTPPGGTAQGAAREPVVVRPQRATRPEGAVIVRSARVFDATGFLVVGAEITVDGRAPTRSDADGRFQVEVAAGQVASVVVQAPGHGVCHLRVQEASPEPLFVQLSPVAPWDQAAEPLPPLRFAGEGRVVGADGRPVAGAEVTALGTDAWARTDASGRYLLPLANTTPVIAVHQAGAGDADHGLVARSEPLRLDRDRGIVPLPELVAVAACALRGIVRDVNGVPVAGVPVRVRGEGLERLVETGSGGAFRIGGLGPGSYMLRPFAFRGMLGAPLSVAVDRALADCELSLQPASERRVRVVDTTGAPVVQAAVAATFAGERTSVQPTDAQGWTRVRLADAVLGDAWRFDVRVGDALTAAASARFEPEQATLVVAMP
jgi:hypothetical protein